MMEEYSSFASIEIHSLKRIEDISALRSNDREQLMREANLCRDMLQVIQENAKRLNSFKPSVDLFVQLPDYTDGVRRLVFVGLGVRYSLRDINKILSALENGESLSQDWYEEAVESIRYTNTQVSVESQALLERISADVA